MKTKATYLAVLAGAWLMAGCDQANHTDQDVSPGTNVTARELKKEVREAVDASKNYAAQNKDQFVASMEKKLQALDEKIAELGAKGETLTDQARAESAEALAALKKQREQLGVKFDEVKESSQAAWEDVKAGFESAYADLEKAYDDFKSRFKK
jgi:outer membrane protein assembly factor BamE (lipoprotein component of BamABCDE complex)